jgi:hypothetical protein
VQTTNGDVIIEIMADITARLTSRDRDSFVCAVEVKEGDSKSMHLVHLNRNYFQDLVNGHENITPEQLVQKSFEFLLEREPKEAILKNFNLKQIEEHFPEYRAEITKHL